MSTAALILAAGASRRFGSPKQLIDWYGVPLLQHVINEVRDWPVDEVFVVLGAHSDQIMEAVDFGGASVIENPSWEEGMASSLRIGLAALENASGFDRTLVALADQPKVRADVVKALLAEQKKSKSPVVVPRYRYTWGNPVLIDRSLWGRIMANISGDVGARSLFQAHPEWVAEVWFEDIPPRDIDTKFDLDDMRPKPPRK